MSNKIHLIHMLLKCYGNDAQINSFSFFWGDGGVEKKTEKKKEILKEDMRTRQYKKGE